MPKRAETKGKEKTKDFRRRTLGPGLDDVFDLRILRARLMTVLRECGCVLSAARSPHASLLRHSVFAFVDSPLPNMAAAGPAAYGATRVVAVEVDAFSDAMSSANYRL